MTGTPKHGKALMVEAIAGPGGCTLGAVVPGTMERICAVVLESEELGRTGAGGLIIGEAGLVAACIFMGVAGYMGRVCGALFGAVGIVPGDLGIAAATGHTLVGVLLTGYI